jgi:hypothetical protein
METDGGFPEEVFGLIRLLLEWGLETAIASAGNRIKPLFPPFHFLYLKLKFFPLRLLNSPV